MEKIYKDSKVELNFVLAKYYDSIINFITFGIYKRFIQKAIKDIGLKPNNSILDMGCGTGNNACLMRKYLSKKGQIIGLDISPVMEKQFLTKCSKFPNTKFIKQRIDTPFDLKEKFDFVFISFAIHGFPQEIREKIIRNALDHLKEGGVFTILDFSEFSLKQMPIYYKIPFKAIECKYAFDFIGRDWKKILSLSGFTDFEEKLYFKNYVRLLKARKLNNI